MIAGRLSQPLSRTLQGCAFLLTVLALINPAFAATPSFKCDHVESSAEKLVCKDDALAQLDWKLAQIYKDAIGKLAQDDIKTQKAIQRGWIKGRNDCWKAENLRQCVESSYTSRITELQIMSGSIVVPKAVVFDCDENRIITAYFYNDTQIPSAVLNLNTEQSLALVSPSASGAKYEGQNVSFWNKGREATVNWKGQDLSCHEIPSSNE